MSKRAITEILDTNSNHNNPPSKKRKLNQQNDANENEKECDQNANEMEEFGENKKIKNALLTSGEPIVLNVGGTKYATSLLTLLADKDSILCKMFDGNFSLKPSKDGSYFIDRNGRYFDYILDYLRNNKLIISGNIQLINSLIVEASFYNLSSFVKRLTVKKILTVSNLLKETDIEFMQSCFNREYSLTSGIINIGKLSKIYTGTSIPFWKINGMDRLVFIICSHLGRFGFYLHDPYEIDTEREKEGIPFGLNYIFAHSKCSHEQFCTGEVCRILEKEPGSSSKFSSSSSMEILINDDFHHVISIHKSDETGRFCMQNVVTDEYWTEFVELHEMAEIQQMEIFQIKK